LEEKKCNLPLGCWVVSDLGKVCQGHDSMVGRCGGQRKSKAAHFRW